MKMKLLLAALILVLAALCGSRLVSAQQAAITDIAGGPGGSPYADTDPAPGARIVEVQVRSGDHVDAVQLVFALSDGRTVTGPRHGGEGGGLNVFRLDPDEYLVGIAGRSGQYIDSIQFMTNKRTSPVFGGRGGDRDFRIEVPGNAQVAGLAGRSGEFLDAIGLTFIRFRREFNSSFGGGPQPGQTALAGGPGGADFFDQEIPDEARIVEVRVEAGEFVDAVQLVYAFPDGRPTEAARHGGVGGRGGSFRLEPGEYIVGIAGRCGKFVDSVRILTNRRMSPPFGGNGGEREYRIEVPDGNQAVGFIGRSGQFIDALGLAYTRNPYQQREMRDRDDRGRDRDRRRDNN